MKKNTSLPAFTLLEVLVAITVFSIFIGFAISAYLSFHRADQEALVTRTLVMEGGQVVDALSADIKANRIDFDFYQVDDGAEADLLGGVRSSLFTSLLEGEHVLNETTLALRSGDDLLRILYVWDSDAKTLTVQHFDMSDPDLPVPADGYTEPLPMISENVFLNTVNFRIFPDQNPYDPENAHDDAIAFQPVVTLDLTFAAEGRVRDEVTLPLHTTVTSRFYQ